MRPGASECGAIAASELLAPYPARVLDDLRARLPWETEFLQAVAEVFASISPVLAQTPRYEREGILERLVEPERTILFRVPWIDDGGNVRVNRGYRVQWSSVLGPYKGGLRLHASVALSSLKFLALEQTFKNALTGLPLGGGKGGSDFSIRNRSEREIMRFCQSFMTELSRHIGEKVDVPAGDIGVGTREIGYLFGQYKRMTRTVDGALTGKALAWGGSRLRPEATGYGIAYFADEMLHTEGESLADKIVAVSGFGNVAWGVVKKIADLGGKVVTLSGPDGFVHDPEGVRGEKIDYMTTLRNGPGDIVKPYAERFGVRYVPGQRPWVVPCDIAIPCAIQNELDLPDAEHLVQNGCRWVVEGANMPTTRAAAERIRGSGIPFVPGKAANAGGVAVSGLEMSQNRVGLTWSALEVDAALKRIMTEIHGLCVDTAARLGRPRDYVQGANAGAFERIAEAMMDQGVV